MVEKLGNVARKEECQLKKAEKNIVSKTLWMVPNWECNRGKKPCRICFATDIMKDAKTNGYEKATSDFFTKTRLLSELPWREVVITGGEPTLDPQLLKATLSAIDPKKDIRIITNGDWILKENNREEIISLISSFNRQIQIDISTHDNWEILNQKISGLWDRLPIGLQSRQKEDAEFSDEKNCHIRIFPEVEDHKVIRLGKVKSNRYVNDYVLLDLKKLISYSKNRNQGIYLISGKNGARVIVNHETPYLVNPTPADIANPKDSPQTVFDKVINFYANFDSFPNKSDNLDLDMQTIGYAKSAFKTGVPIDIYSTSYEFRHSSFRYNPEIKNRFIAQNRELMNSYYQALSETSNMSIPQIKELIAERIAVKMLEIDKHFSTRCYYVLGYDSLPLTYDIARSAPRTPASLAHMISKKLFPWEPVEEVDKETSLIKNSHSSPYNAIMHDFFDYPDLDNFLDHLEILNITEKSIAEKLERLTVKD